MILFDLPLPLVLVGLFLLGAVLGSFLNVCIYRIPQEPYFLPQLKRLWGPASSCPRCGRRLLPRDNIPILGWLLLKGRCRFCRGRISSRYPLIELFNAILFVVVYLCEIPVGRGGSVGDSCLYSDVWWQTLSASGALNYGGQAALLHVRYAYHLVLIEMLIAATFIDFDHWVIPDGITLPPMLVGLVGGAAGQLWLVPLWFENTTLIATAGEAFPWLAPLLWTTERSVPEWIGEHPHLHGLAASLAGLAVGGGVVWLVRIIAGGVLRKEAMGFGDVVLMAAVGSYLGWQPAVVVFLLAPFCALGSMLIRWIVHRRREIPFGPYLSIATLVLLLGWRQIWPRVDQIFALGSLLLPLSAVALLLLAALLLASQIVKRMLGIPLDEQQWYAEWTSADQLTHFAGEKVDPHVGGWRASGRDSQWPGRAAGRGLLHEQRWRSAGHSR